MWTLIRNVRVLVVVFSKPAWIIFEGFEQKKVGTMGARCELARKRTKGSGAERAQDLRRRVQDAKRQGSGRKNAGLRTQNAKRCYSKAGC